MTDDLLAMARVTGVLVEADPLRAERAELRRVTVREQGLALFHLAGIVGLIVSMPIIAWGLA